MSSLLLVISLLQLLATSLQSVDAAIGVCYGNKGDNLPSVQEVIQLYRQYNITVMRIYDPNPEVLRALQGTDIQLSLDITADNIPIIASSQAAADSYVHDHIQPYFGTVKFRYIAVGNEVEPGHPSFKHIVPAIENIQRSISAVGLNDTKVSTCFRYNLEVSFPPSAGSFLPQYDAVMKPLVNVLRTNGAPYMVNVYPFFAYQQDPGGIGREFALFTAESAVVRDGEYTYGNLFDASVDAVYAALERYDGGASVKVVVLETGWATVGGSEEVTTVENARLYNSNLVKHVNGGKGTPRRAGEEIEAYIFEMFNENRKPVGIEANFGLFYPDQTPVYPVSF